jgi:hypothetical protein
MQPLVKAPEYTGRVPVRSDVLEKIELAMIAYVTSL